MATDPTSPKEIVARCDRLKSARANFEAHWDEVAQFLFPAREFISSGTPGRKRMSKIFSTTPILACEQLAGGLHGMLTSPALRWFQLVPTDAALAMDEAVQVWFADATERMYRVFNSPYANFANSAHENYMDISAFGTAVMYVRDTGKRGPVYEAIPLSDCLMDEGISGKIDTLYRPTKMAARLIMQEWPEKAGEKVRKAAEKDPDLQFDVVHAVIPNQAGDRWTSKYILRDDLIELEKGTYKAFPFIAARWTKRSGEVYGNGAGMNALPDVKLVNKLEETNLRGLQKVIDPPLMAPDDGFLNPISMRPGAVNMFRAGMVGENDRIMALQTGARPDIGREEIIQIEGRIEAIFYSRWMNLPTQPNMTATEVLQRRDEMLRLLGPMVSRLTAEMLGPVIERTFAIMWENGLFAPAPPALEGAEWTAEYLSPLAISQKSSDADAVLRWLGAIGQMAQVDPSAVEVIDAPETARFLADRYNVPPHLARSREAMAQLAAQRQQAQQIEQEAAAGEAAARIAKTGAGAVRELAQAGQVAGVGAAA